MPGSFDPQQQLNGGRPLLAGPLVLDKGETAVKLYVCVYQDNAACVTVLDDFPDLPPGRWTANPAPADYTGGPFQPGPATAMALLVSRTAGGQYEVYQWTRGVLLA